MAKNRVVTYATTILIILFIGMIIWLTPTDNLHLNQAKIYDFNSGWTATLEDGTVKEVTLPTHFDIPANQWISIEQEIKDDFPQDMSLRIRSLMQEHRVYIDGELIFEKSQYEASGLRAPVASAWIVVDLPNDSQGKTIKLMSRTDVSVFAGDMNKLDYGSKDALKFEIINKQPIGIIIGITIFIVGLLFLIAGILIANYSDMRFHYLGLFSIMISIWLLSEMDLMQFVTGNRVIIGGISYIVLPLIPIYFLLYLKQVVLIRYERIIYPLTGAFFLFFLANIFLQAMGLYHFIELAYLVNVMIAVSVIWIMMLLVEEYKKYKNPIAGRYLLYLSIFALTVLMEIMAFFTNFFVLISSYSSIGFIIFFVLLIADSLRYINNIIVEEGENQALKKLAFKDILTGAHNRAAFEKDVDSLIGEDKRFRLVISDMNRLKMINDTYGHLEGDRAIKVCYTCLQEAFEAYGTCYRLGGDEFALLLDPIDDELYDRCKKRTIALVNERNNGYKYQVSVALGSDIYRHIPCFNFGDFMHQVDIMMYDDKRNMNR